MERGGLCSIFRANGVALSEPPVELHVFNGDLYGVHEREFWRVPLRQLPGFRGTAGATSAAMSSQREIRERLTEPDSAHFGGTRFLVHQEKAYMICDGGLASYPLDSSDPKTTWEAGNFRDLVVIHNQVVALELDRRTASTKSPGAPHYEFELAANSDTGHLLAKMDKLVAITDTEFVICDQDGPMPAVRHSANGQLKLCALDNSGRLIMLHQTGNRFTLTQTPLDAPSEAFSLTFSTRYDCLQPIKLVAGPDHLHFVYGSKGSICIANFFCDSIGRWDHQESKEILTEASELIGVFCTDARQSSLYLLGKTASGGGNHSTASGMLYTDHKVADKWVGAKHLMANYKTAGFAFADGRAVTCVEPNGQVPMLKVQDIFEEDR